MVGSNEINSPVRCTDEKTGSFRIKSVRVCWVANAKEHYGSPNIVRQPQDSSPKKDAVTRASKASYPKLAIPVDALVRP